MGKDSEKWSVEKERLAKATIEERREGYSCGDKYERLDDIPTLKETPPPHLSEKDKKRIEEKLLKNFPLDEDVGDLSDKEWKGDWTIVDLDPLEIICVPEYGILDGRKEKIGRLHLGGEKGGLQLR